MTNNIVEADQPMGTAAAVIEKKARQLVYDSRYEVKGQLKGKKVDSVTLERMILSRISQSKAIPAVIARAKQMVFKKPIVKETYASEIKSAATTSVADALFKVFVEGLDPIIPDYLEELRGLDDKKYKIRVTDPKSNNSYVRYGTREKIEQLRQQGLKVELTEYGDPREDRAKKSSKSNDGNLANNYPPYNKVTRGDVIAGATGKDEMGGKNVKEELVGNQSEIDANQNGKIDGQDFKLLRKKRKNRVDEDFLVDGTDSTKGKSPRAIDGKNVDNYSNGTVTVSPKDGSQSNSKGSQSSRGIYAHTEIDGQLISETGYSKFLNMLSEKSVSVNQQQAAGAALSAKRGDIDPSTLKGASLEMYNSMTEKQLRDFAKTKHKGLPEKVEDVKEEMGVKCPKCGKSPCKCDNRAVKTYRDLLKNKLRAVGMRNPIMLDTPDDEKVMDLMTKSKVDTMTVSASYEPEGKIVDEARALGKAGRGGDNNPRGAAVRASSGRGMTMTPARGLGASKPEGDDKERASKQAAQAKADRRAAARDRAAEGEDRLSRLVRSIQNNSFELEGEVIDERTRERKGQPRPERNRATEFMRNLPDVKKGLMTRSGRTVAQHEAGRGVKKEPGAPTPTGETTADRLEAKKRRAAAAQASAQRAREEEDRRRRLA